MKKILFLVIVIALFSVSVKAITCYSPDGQTSMTVTLEKGEVFYSVNVQDKQIIAPSQMSVLLNNKPLIKDIAYLHTFKLPTANETYTTRGVHSLATNHYNGMVVALQDDQKRRLAAVEMRLFNEGISFRYWIERSGENKVMEDTHFVLPKDNIIWSQPNIKNYEGIYLASKLSDLKPETQMGPPIVMEYDNNLYLAITEAGLTDFCGMHLLGSSDGVLRTAFTHQTEQSANFETPWRVILIGDLNQLVNSDIIGNLSYPASTRLFPQGERTPWLKEGKSVWSWLTKNRAVSLKNMKQFAKSASELGFQYNLVDEGWQHWSQDPDSLWAMVDELVKYSKSLGVETWLWKAYPDRKGIPGLKTKENRQTFFRKAKEHGVAGLKIDFFDNESPETILFYQEALREAAELELMINFHGVNKPTGETKTFPNEMSREGIRGMEFRSASAHHNTILPFTRMLAGHADFTPLTLDDPNNRKCTYVHQIACMGLYWSPVQCIAADPEKLLQSPMLGMIKSIPQTWDETIVLPQSKIGKVALFLRRKGNTWFIFGTSDQVYETEVSLDFLPKRNYILTTLEDGNQAENSIKVTRKEKIFIKMSFNGGYVARLTPR